MMIKPTIRIHDIATNELVDREMTDIEFEEYQAMQAESAEKLAAAERKANEKAILLNRLGLTEDELKTILG
jgi:hypothetical protein